MKNPKERFIQNTAEKNPDESVEKPEETKILEEVEVQKSSKMKGPISKEVLEELKTELTDEINKKIEGHKDSIIAGNSAESRVEMYDKTLTEIPQILNIKRNELLAKYGEENKRKIEDLLASLNTDLNNEMSDFMSNTSKIRANKKLLDVEQSNMEILKETGRVKWKQKLSAEKTRTIKFLQSNGIKTEGDNDFTLREKATRLYNEIEDLKDELKGVNIYSQGVINHPDGELAALKELSEANKTPEKPKKKTLGDKIKGLFNIN